MDCLKQYHLVISVRYDKKQQVFSQFSYRKIILINMKYKIKTCESTNHRHRN